MITLILLALLGAQVQPAIVAGDSADELEMRSTDSATEDAELRAKLRLANPENPDRWARVAARVQAQIIYEHCAIQKVAGYSLQPEPASVVARASLGMCGEEARAFEFWTRNTSETETESAAWVKKIEDGLLEMLTAVTIEMRQQDMKRQPPGVVSPGRQ